MNGLDGLILDTERLLLRPYRTEDAEAVFHVVSRREIAETTIMVPHPYPRRKVDGWIHFIRANIEKGTGFEFGLFFKDGRLSYIGNCGLVGISKEHRNAELVYFIHPDFWNRGFATEACKRIIRFGFEELGLERIYGRCMAKNTGSRRVMEKAGFRYEGLGRHEVFKWGRFEDVARFGLIRSEWAVE